jgi:endonuclease YncB( thermonuclease family)
MLFAVAEVFLGNQSVNLQMVKEGQAVVYRSYLDSCAATKDQYLKAEADMASNGYCVCALAFASPNPKLKSAAATGASHTA